MPCLLIEMKCQSASVRIRRTLDPRRSSWRNSRNRDSYRPEGVTILATVIERQIDLFAGVEHPVALHVQVTEMGPAATRCAGTIDDTPPVLCIPLPHDPAFAHPYIMTPGVDYRLSALD